jgi:hypothetical protein
VQATVASGRITAVASLESPPGVLEQVRVAIDAVLRIIVSTDETETALRHTWPDLQHPAGLVQANPKAIERAVVGAIDEAIRAARMRDFDTTCVARVTARVRLVRFDHHCSAP